MFLATRQARLKGYSSDTDSENVSLLWLAESDGQTCSSKLVPSINIR